MFGNLVRLLFGGEDKHDIPVDSAIDEANAEELKDHSLGDDCVSSARCTNDDKKNGHDLMNFDTDEEDDWLLVNVSDGSNSHSKAQNCLKMSTGSQSSLQGTGPERQKHENNAFEISSEIENVEASKSQTEKEVPTVSLEASIPETLKLNNPAQEITPQVGPTAQDSIVNYPQSKLEMNIYRPTKAIMLSGIPSAVRPKRKYENGFVFLVRPITTAQAANWSHYGDTGRLKQSHMPIWYGMQGRRLQHKYAAYDVSPQYKSSGESNCSPLEGKMVSSISKGCLSNLKINMQGRQKYKNALIEKSLQIKNAKQGNKFPSRKAKYVNSSIELQLNLQNVIEKQIQEELRDLKKLFKEWDQFRESIAECIDDSLDPSEMIESFYTCLQREEWLEMKLTLNQAQYKVQGTEAAKQSMLRSIQEQLKSIDRKLQETELLHFDSAECLKKYEESCQPSPPAKATFLQDHVERLRPQQKAREWNVWKQIAPSQLDRQNKVKLYEGKPKNNRRKDLWRCHSGANNNRKCC